MVVRFQIHHDVDADTILAVAAILGALSVVVDLVGCRPREREEKGRREVEEEKAACKDDDAGSKGLAISTI